MRVPKISEPVLRHRRHRDREAARKRLPEINISQELTDAFPVGEEDISMEEDIDITMEEDIELPLEFMEEDEVDSLSEMFEEEGV